MSTEIVRPGQPVPGTAIDLIGAFGAPAGPAESGSPEWWRDRLLKRIGERAERIQLIRDYVEGRHRMAFATSKYREAFGELLSPLRDDWISAVAEAAVERLVVVGFRFGVPDETGDQDAWAIWQANGMDARAGLAHDEAVKFGTAYIAVGPAEDGGEPVMLVLPPSRAAVERDPSQPMRRLAGVHCWVEPDGSSRVRLWTPKGWWEWASESPVPVLASWQLVDDGENEVGVVPIVPLPNRPNLASPDGQSDVWSVIPVQDAINKLLADMMIASEFAAFRQRWATGVEIPTDPVTKQPLNDQWVSGVTRILTVEEDGARFGEFGASDLANYTKPIEMAVQHIAAQTRTPPHYLMGEIVNVSADGIRAADAGLVSRVRGKMATFGEGWEEAVRIAFAWKGDLERAGETSCEVMWRDPETRTEGERVDALVKLSSLGVPREALWARIPGVTPQEIERWRSMADAEALRQGLTLGLTPSGAPPELPGS